jgi:hypothetical protein
MSDTVCQKSIILSIVTKPDVVNIVKSDKAAMSGTNSVVVLVREF